MTDASSKIIAPMAAMDPKDPIVQLLGQVAICNPKEVAATDPVEVLLREQGLLYEAAIPNRLLGLDPANRNGQEGPP